MAAFLKCEVSNGLFPEHATVTLIEEKGGLSSCLLPEASSRGGASSIICRWIW
jgi:hypothetical protein